MSSSYLIFGLPLRLVAYSFPYNIFFGVAHPSSGVLKTVTAASGTGHNIGTATSIQRGLIGTGLCEQCDVVMYLPHDSNKPVPIRPRWRELAVPVL